MSGSTFVVAMNALLLKRTKLAGIRKPDTDKAAPSAEDQAMPASSAPAAVSAGPNQAVVSPKVAATA